ncbi:dehydrogenase/reductase SDR family member on chromosome X isoform X1 [Senna tora]|uniref:Dehydrogenase/reductase SDR family member on chromosome X isoform X1 n=1 Tax=Senna tora TaxID=362788 RepID=A0A834U1Y4_9FABA|nr:dehydrogenase/reductase SDR family member on chromosome X isoform X1 [Senna tora]
MSLCVAMKELSDAFSFVCSLEFWRMSVLWTYYLILSYWKLFEDVLFSRKIKSYPRCCPSTKPARPVCVITGATSGLGAATVRALCKEGYFVVIVGRSSQLLLETVKKMKGCNEDAQLKAFQVDLSSMKSIVTFKKSLQHWLLESDLHCSVQLLINNAGILATSHKVTTEGYDQMIGTNYIGAFAMTMTLLPLLERSPVTSRIVNVTSFTHRSVTGMQVDEKTVSGKRFLSSKPYPCAHIYEYSKCKLQILDEAVDPGAVQTNIMREVPSLLSCLAYKILGLLGLLQTPERGINSIIDAALAPPEASGAYFFGGKGRTIKSSELSRNPKLARQLWETTSKLLKQTPFGPEDTQILASGAKFRSSTSHHLDRINVVFATFDPIRFVDRLNPAPDSFNPQMPCIAFGSTPLTSSDLFLNV